MSHLQLTSPERDWCFIVETKNGTEVVPVDVCGGDFHHVFKPNTAFDQPWLLDILKDHLGDYLECQEIIWVELKLGWFGRLSAPGYLDCTPWIFDTTKRGLLDQLKEY